MPSRFRNSDYIAIGDATYQVLKNEEHNEAVTKIWGYKTSKKRTILLNFFSVLLLGLPYVVFAWFPKCKVIKYDRCRLSKAALVLVSNSLGCNEFIPIKTDTLRIASLRQFINLRYFYYQHTKYVFIRREESFVPLTVFIKFPSLHEIVEYSSGLSMTEQINMLSLHGSNSIDIEVKSYWNLFKSEVFNPFNVFQAFSIILWCFENYYVYAVCIFVLTMLSIAITLYQTRKQSEALHEIVNSTICKYVRVLRPKAIFGHTEVKISSTDLVPGDLLVIPQTGCIMPCDAVILNGSCIINESMLTGESIPVTKTPPNPSDELYNPLHHKRHTLFAGTEVLQTRVFDNEYVTACVVRTGFNTTKGSLVKSILFPAPVGLKFYSDSLKFIFVLFIIAIGGMFYSMMLYVERHMPFPVVLVHMLDIITVVVPPALPAAMTVGIYYSQIRLKQLGIYCISPIRINICGKIKLACFDKTGTLTNEGLELYSIIPTRNAHFVKPVTNFLTFSPKNIIIQGMAACHSLTKIDKALIGDPLDINLFEHTRWELEEPTTQENLTFDHEVHTIVHPSSNFFEHADLISLDEIPYEIGIMKTFPFSSIQQCMSVICQVSSNSSLLAFTKGAPEKIHSLCHSDSIPCDFNERLIETTSQGFRVIALAYKQLPSSFMQQTAKREDVESSLIFLGLISLKNTLKNETSPVIATLHKANIRTVMITGDNIRTAISVARECKMIEMNADVILVTTKTEHNQDELPSVVFTKLENNNHIKDENVLNFDNSHVHFAVDGKTWSSLKVFYPDLIPKLLVRGTVFARFQPDQKTQLVTQFQKLDYVVSMVGDGANDCGALKAAHVGVSLSQAEAGVAAPFTSSNPDISCILHLITEGRCALVTSFAVFKYMAMYSLIQFMSVLLLYRNRSLLGNNQYLFIDLFITTSLAFAIARQGPVEKLAQKRPAGSLISTTTLIPLVLQIFLCGALQAGALIFLSLQPWFEPLPPGVEMVTVCWQNTVVFTTSMYQYVIMGFVYSKGKPHRQPRLTNPWFLIIIATLLSVITWVTIYPITAIEYFFEVISISSTGKEAARFRYKLLAFPMAHLIVASFIENCIADRAWFKKVIHFVICKRHPKNRFRQLLKDTIDEDLTRI